MVVLKTINGPCSQFVRNRNFRCQIRNQRPKRHKNGWCSNRIAEKMVITTRPTAATARGTELKPVQHSLVFREYNMSQRSSTDVHLQPIYEPISIYFFFKILLCYSWQQEPGASLTGGGGPGCPDPHFGKPGGSTLALFTMNHFSFTLNCINIKQTMKILMNVKSMLQKDAINLPSPAPREGGWHPQTVFLGCSLHFLDRRRICCIT